VAEDSYDRASVLSQREVSGKRELRKRETAAGGFPVTAWGGEKPNGPADVIPSVGGQSRGSAEGGAPEELRDWLTLLTGESPQRREVEKDDLRDYTRRWETSTKGSWLLEGGLKKGGLDTSHGLTNGGQDARSIKGESDTSTFSHLGCKRKSNLI